MNLLNIPAKGKIGEKIRAAFVAKPGYKLIINDFSSQEPKYTADKCGDPALVDFHINGDGDPHSLTANKMFTLMLGEQTNISKDNPYVIYRGKKVNARQIGKVVTLKTDYGATAYTVKDDLGESQEVAQTFIDALENAFPLKKKYFEEKIAETFRNGYILIDNITNRKAFIDRWEEFKSLEAEINSKRFKEKYYYLRDTLNEDSFKATPEYKRKSYYNKWRSSIERDSKNYPIQGGCAGISKLAGIWMDREFRKRKLDAYLVNFIYDEWVVECEKSIAQEVAAITQDCMERAGKVFCKTVPMVAIPDISDYWRKG